MINAPSQHASSTLEPNTIVLGGRYRVDRYLGRGSFGEVYAVTYLPTDAHRAMKVVRRSGRGAAALMRRYEERFARELKLAERVHDGSERDVRVLRAFELVMDADALYGVVELAQGGSLAEELSRRAAQGQPVGIEQAVRWLTDAADGLRSLHRVGAVHVDVKPSNILLMAHGGAVIGDLGSAQLASETANPNEREYAVDYGSPEHGQAPPLTAAADVYGLGCVAFELLTGERWAPWLRTWSGTADATDGERASGLERDVAACVAEALSELRPESLDWSAPLLAGMLQPQVARPGADSGAVRARFGSMDEILALLARARRADAAPQPERRPGRRRQTPRAASDGDAADRPRDVEASADAAGVVPDADPVSDPIEQLDAALDLLDAGDDDGALALLTALRDAGYRSPADDLDALIGEAERLVAEARARAKVDAAAAAQEAAGVAAYVHVVRLAKRVATRGFGRVAWERYLAEYPGRDDPEGMEAFYPRPAADDAIQARARLSVVTPTAEQQALLDVMLDFSRPPEERAEAGRKLSAIGDPRPGVGLRADGVPDIEWVEAPGGSFTRGEVDRSTWDGTSAPRRTVEVARFWISRYATTWAQYEAFLTARDGYRNVEWWDGLAMRQPQPGKQKWPLANHPAENVSWYDASAYTRWLSARLGYEVLLPTEEQWEKAAQGTDGRRYPWGNAYEGGRANIYELWPEDAPAGADYLEGTTAVGIYLQNNPYDLADITGNVWEWTLTEWASKRSDALGSSSPRAVRGGSWLSNHELARASYRYWHEPALRSDGVGFRVVSCAPPRL